MTGAVAPSRSTPEAIDGASKSRSPHSDGRLDGPDRVEPLADRGLRHIRMDERIFADEMTLPAVAPGSGKANPARSLARSNFARAGRAAREPCGGDELRLGVADRASGRASKKRRSLPSSTAPAWCDGANPSRLVFIHKRCPPWPFSSLPPSHSTAEADLVKCGAHVSRRSHQPLGTIAPSP